MLSGTQGSEVMAMFENITMGQVAAFVAFVVALYAGVKYLKKELKDAITEMLKDEFRSVDEKLDKDNRRLNDLEEQQKFLYKAISLLLQDDLAILEHLRTDNATGKMAKQEQKDGVLPEFQGELKNIDQYKTVLIGGPVWWGTY